MKITIGRHLEIEGSSRNVRFSLDLWNSFLSQNRIRRYMRTSATESLIMFRHFVSVQHEQTLHKAGLWLVDEIITAREAGGTFSQAYVILSTGGCACTHDRGMCCVRGGRRVCMARRCITVGGGMHGGDMREKFK